MPRKRRWTAKQLEWRRKFAAMVKSGRFKKRKHNPKLAKRRRRVVRTVSRTVTRTQSNAPAVKIYERVGYIVAKKGPGHKCDRACVRAGHWYKHKFTSKAGIYGLQDGTLRIR